jgi:hypothetical protein
MKNNLLAAKEAPPVSSLTRFRRNGVLSAPLTVPLEQRRHTFCSP